ncbi:thiamine pyrophosphate-dependent enzyme [Orrella sp. 11846]|uniref:thiamine pyrophosphate-dependent enzyme n=1 Tax=Orrella sp. 11846 TaxID=3409913 RepID=UPI003B5AE7C1
MSNTDQANAKIMNRADLTRRLKAAITDEEIIIGGIGHTNFDLWGAGHRPKNFYMLGSMGSASAIGLGVALGQPNRIVYALDGDGSILMQLGTLGTIASTNVTNLVVIIWDNGCYQITGGQPTATSSQVDLAEVARGLGIQQAFWAKDEQDFEALIARTRTEPGPWFIVAHTDNEKPAVATDRDPPQIRDRFMRGLGVKGEWGR